MQSLSTELPIHGEQGKEGESKVIMACISAVNNQTLNSSELQSVLGEGGHVALNVISLIILSLPLVHHRPSDGQDNSLCTAHHSH